MSSDVMCEVPRAAGKPTLFARAPGGTERTTYLLPCYHCSPGPGHCTIAGRLLPPKAQSKAASLAGGFFTALTVQTVHLLIYQLVTKLRAAKIKASTGVRRRPKAP